MIVVVAMAENIPEIFCGMQPSCQIIAGMKVRICSGYVDLTVVEKCSVNFLSTVYSHFGAAT